MTAVDGREEAEPLAPMLFAPGRVVTLGLNEERGVDVLTVQVDSLYWGAVGWCPEPQWWLRAWDIEKQTMWNIPLANVVPAA